MKTIKLHLKAEEPLIITDGTSEGMSHETLNYIPGSMLLGAFASVWIRNHRTEDPDKNDIFNALFLNNSVKWGSAYPTVWNESEELETVPVPLTFQKIKNYDGLPTAQIIQVQEENRADTQSSDFKMNEKDDRRVLNLIRIDPDNDLVLRDYCKEKLKWKFDEDEGVKTKKIDGGFMTIDGCCQPLLKSGFNTHVAMDNQRHGAEHQLFGYSSLNAGTTFISEVICEDSVVEDLKKLLSSVDNIFVGHSRSAGYGRLSFISDKEKNATEPSVSLGKTKDAYLFLSSPYIPKHSWEKPVDSLERELVKAGLDENCIQRNELSCRFRTISGFNGKWKLPRESRTAIVAGSVIKLSVKEGQCVNIPCALGADTAEGYGRVLVNPEFLEKLSPDLKEYKKTIRPNNKTLRSGPVLNVLKRKGMERLCEQKVFMLLGSPLFKNFIDSVKGSKVTASQRGNMRSLVTERKREDWAEVFNQVLEKTPGKKWENSDALWSCSDSSVSGYRESLSVIMKELLDVRRFTTSFGNYLHLNSSEIISPLTGEEQKKFEEMFHKRFMLELLNAWGKAENNKTEEK